MIRQFINIGLMTTYKTNSVSKYYAICDSIDDLYIILNWCNNIGVPWFVLGNGSNILASDNGFDGLTIKLGKDFERVCFDCDFLETGSSVLLPTLSRHFMSRGWGGYEFMSGIPGTVGGAVVMNAGSKIGEIKDGFLEAKVLTEHGNICSINKDDMNFAYRYSSLQNNKDIVLTVKFKERYLLDKEVIKNNIKNNILNRRKKQPKNKRNCGSVFKKPEGEYSAGWYIEKAGLKGLKIGGAMVSNEHGNWILNFNNATANDIKNLIQIVQEKVLLKFQINLERELIYLPEDLA